MTPPKIVRPEHWYMAFWLFAFLPCYGVTVYVAVKYAVLAALASQGR